MVPMKSSARVLLMVVAVMAVTCLARASMGRIGLHPIANLAAGPEEMTPGARTAKWPLPVGAPPGDITPPVVLSTMALCVGANTQMATVLIDEPGRVKFRTKVSGHGSGRPTTWGAWSSWYALTAGNTGYVYFYDVLGPTSWWNVEIYVEDDAGNQAVGNNYWEQFQNGPMGCP